MNVGARRWWALGALAVTLLAVGLDLTVLNIALPTVATDLHASTSQLQWFVDSYTLVLAALLLPAGSLGDRFGRKKLLLGALVVFGAASLACAYASSPGELIAARAALGLGAAFLMPLSMAVLPVLFSAEERPRAIAVWSAANAIGFPLGPILGGWLLDHFWWGSVFLINVPVVAVALVAVATLLPESGGTGRERLDFVGVLTSSLGLVGLTYGVISQGEHGWGDAGTLAWLIAGVALLVVFVFLERRNTAPLVDLSLFRSASFTVGATLLSLVSFAMFGLLFSMPQYFQAVKGADALGTGLRLLPMVGGLLVGTVLGGRVARKVGAKITVAVGFVLLTASALVGATTDSHAGYGYTLSWLAVLGVGMGFAMPTATDAALGALSTARSGIGSALLMALRQVGGLLGVAVLGTVLSTSYHSRLNVAGLPAPAAEAVGKGVNTAVAVARRVGSPTLLDSVRSAFVYGMDVTLWVSGGILAFGVVLALAFLPARSATMEETEDERAGSERGVIA
jgi:EmrB/QacA subfamily drug resistance transporter